MSRLIIRGGNRIAGMHRAPGNKNAALPMLTAALLTDETVTLDNLPIIDDVKTTLLQLEKLGVDVTLDSAARRVSLRAGKLKSTCLDRTLCAKVRSAILFAGPLLGRCGRATICQPGGDLIGRRRVDTHINGLRALGASVTPRNGYAFRSRGLAGATFCRRVQVTATENLVMAAVLARATNLYHAPASRMCRTLCRLLNAMGASISASAPTGLTSTGSSACTARRAHRADFIGGRQYLTAAWVTGGALTIEGIGRRISPSRRAFQFGSNGPSRTAT